MEPTAIAPATREDDTVPSPRASAAADAVAPSIWRCTAVVAVVAVVAATVGYPAIETKIGMDMGVIHALRANDRAVAKGGVGVCRTVHRDTGGDEVQQAAMKRREMAMESRIGIMTVLIIVIETVDGIKRLGMHRRQHRSPEKEV